VAPVDRLTTHRDEEEEEEEEEEEGKQCNAETLYSMLTYVKIKVKV